MWGSSLLATRPTIIPEPWLNFSRAHSIPEKVTWDFKPGVVVVLDRAPVVARAEVEPNPVVEPKNSDLIKVSDLKNEKILSGKQFSDF